MQAVNLGVFLRDTIPCSIPDGSQSVFHVPAAVCAQTPHRQSTCTNTCTQKGVFVCRNQHCQVWNRVPDCITCYLHYPLGVCDPWVHLHQQHIFLEALV